MFRCQVCQKVVPQGTSAQKVTVRTRTKSYPSRGTSPSERRFARGRVAKPGPFDKGGDGNEIVQEISVCPSCATEYQEN